MSKIDAVQILIDFFQETSWPADLSEGKLRERSSVVPDGNGTGLIVEIERHRAVLGAHYTKGCAMAAYETYFMRYAISAAGAKVTELPVRSSCVDFDARALASEFTGYERVMLRVIQDGDAYEIYDDVSSNRETVKNSQDAQLFGREIADLAIEEFTEVLKFEAYQCLTSSQRNSLVEEVSSAIYEQISLLVDRAWDNPDVE